VTVSPSSGSFKAGDVLTCTSDGFSEPSYTWTNGDGVVVSTASTTTLREGWFNLTCTGTGNFSDPCSASTTIIGHVTMETVDSNPTTTRFSESGTKDLEHFCRLDL